MTTCSLDTLRHRQCQHRARAVRRKKTSSTKTPFQSARADECCCTAPGLTLPVVTLPVVTLSLPLRGLPLLLDAKKGTERRVEFSSFISRHARCAGKGGRVGAVAIGSVAGMRGRGRMGVGPRIVGGYHSEQCALFRIPGHLTGDRGLVLLRTEASIVLLHFADLLKQLRGVSIELAQLLILRLGAELELLDVLLFL